ncbi:MAG: glycosyl hydrolase [Candidatus Poribacteria bacterium]
MEDIYQVFVNPPNEFTQIPWWFWNDEITEDGIREQLADFRQQGVYGFTIHARMGLARSIPYLGERWFELVRFVVEEAARHGMVVHLYDEGMYPSGSAHGQVVQGHPEFLARGLEMRRVEPSEELKLNMQEKCIAIRLGGQTEAIPITSVSKVPRSGPYWAFVITLSGGTIRGVHEGEDDGQPNAPKAADLLNPAAVRRFIQCTHERYYRELKGYFGATVQAIFTDEPSIMGRGAKRGLKPWTDGFEEYFRQKKGYDLLKLLPALWIDTGSRTERIRRDYEEVVAERLNDSFYKQLSEWCAAHNIALTGHPAGSDDIGLLRYFQLPGQDMVWRYVEPEKPTALEGQHSTAAKCSSSAARHQKARRNGNELYGAYGWNLKFDEMKWLADWFMVRGVNLFWPHAFYYSIRDFRAHERPPDLGRHNLWWKHYHILANYTKRLCWLLTDAEQVCDIAILARHNHLPWEPAKVLFQNQWDFNYLEDRLLTESTVENGRLSLEEASYSTIVRMSDHILPEFAESVLEHFVQSGGRVVSFERTEDGTRFLSQLEEFLLSDVVIEPANPDLRYIHVRKGGYDFYYLTNEGGNPIEGKLTVRSLGHTEWWDPLAGKSDQAIVPAQHEDSICVALRLERREARVLSINPQRAPILQPAWREERVIQRFDISTGWKFTPPAPRTQGVHWEEIEVILSEELIDWTTLEGYSNFSVTVVYEKTLDVTPQMLESGTWMLGLGEVHDFAEVFCNGISCGVRLWGPFRFELPLKPGLNKLRVEVTNSMANRMEGASLPSGMLGPVVLEKIEFESSDT